MRISLIICLTIVFNTCLVSQSEKENELERISVNALEYFTVIPIADIDSDATNSEILNASEYSLAKCKMQYYDIRKIHEEQICNMARVGFLYLSHESIPGILFTTIKVSLELKDYYGHSLYKTQVEVKGKGFQQGAREGVLKSIKRLAKIYSFDNTLDVNSPAKLSDQLNLTDSEIKSIIVESNDNLSGIYKPFGENDGLNRRIAIIKNGFMYNIVNMDENLPCWSFCETKGNIEPTAVDGLYSTELFSYSRLKKKDIYISINPNNNVMSMDVETKEERYVKVFPNDNASSSSLIQGSNSTNQGTAFVISKDGYICTNQHVIDNKSQFTVTFEIKDVPYTYNCILVSQDKKNDIAVLKIVDEKFKPFSFLPYKFATDLQKGAKVYSLGFPETQIMGNTMKINEGIINGLQGYKGDPTTYQISVPLHNGNSGGPLIDIHGNISGITSSGLIKSDFENVNYAIKIEYLRAMLEKDNVQIKINDSNTRILSASEISRKFSNYICQIRAI